MLPSMSTSRAELFKWRHFEPAVITCAVSWYLRFSLSYRNVEELLTERGLGADHTTVWRWVQRYAPILDQRCRRELKPTNGSWRVDETYVRVKGKWMYLFRAVDSAGATVDFLLGAHRDADAAKRFSRKPCVLQAIRGPESSMLTAIPHIQRRWRPSKRRRNSAGDAGVAHVPT